MGKVTFSGQARANLVDENTAQLLKKMGSKSIGMGLESGCEDTLKYLKGGSITVEDNKKAVTIIKKYGMWVYGSFIIGAPKETKKDILTTFEFIKNSKLDWFDISILTPLPGTPIWEYAESRGLVSENMDWARLNMNFADDFENSIIVSETLSREELHRLFKMFLKEKMKRNFFYLIKSGLRHPTQVPGYLKFLKIFD